VTDAEAINATVFVLFLFVPFIIGWLVILRAICLLLIDLAFALAVGGLAVGRWVRGR
jgi:hypothetical protein